MCKACSTPRRALGAKRIETFDPATARQQPTPADAVKSVVAKNGMSAEPDPGDDARSQLRSGSDGDGDDLQARCGEGAGPLPIIVYFHGGGWVIADVKAYDATPRFLSKQLNALVVSVEYRHAPESKSPGQHEDAAMGSGWVLKNSASWRSDGKRMALTGESAGGDVAVATAIYARDHHMQMPVHILSVYPIANPDMTLPSRMDNAASKPLTTAMLSWFTYYYAKSSSDLMDPRINLISADLHGLPKTTIINAQNDPLRSDGETLSTAMSAAGDSVERRVFPGVTHEFFGMGKVVRGADDAEGYAVTRLKPLWECSNRYRPRREGSSRPPLSPTIHTPEPLNAVCAAR